MGNVGVRNAPCDSVTVNGPLVLDCLTVPSALLDAFGGKSCRRLTRTGKALNDEARAPGRGSPTTVQKPVASRRPTVNQLMTFARVARTSSCVS
jgi:hypothetical protein